MPEEIIENINENPYPAKIFNFIDNLETVVNDLNSIMGRYDDGAGKQFKDWLIYDRLDMLKKDDIAGGGTAEQIIDIQKKIREAFLLSKDLLDFLRMYSD